jgi:hypothetical protein
MSLLWLMHSIFLRYRLQYRVVWPNLASKLPARGPCPPPVVHMGPLISAFQKPLLARSYLCHSRTLLRLYGRCSNLFAHVLNDADPKADPMAVRMTLSPSLEHVYEPSLCQRYEEGAPSRQNKVFTMDRR